MLARPPAQLGEDTGSAMEQPPNQPGDPQPEPQVPPGHLYRIAWGLYMMLAVAGGVWIGLREGRVELTLFLDTATVLPDLALGVAAGLVLLGLWEVGRRTLALARELEESIARVLASVEPQEAFALALLSGFAEELFFRGAVQGAFAQHGWLWAAVIFALVHTGPGRAFRMWALFALVAGLIFGALMVWRGNLLAPVVAHVLVNAVNLRRIILREDPGPHEGAPPEP